MAKRQRTRGGGVGVFILVNRYPTPKIAGASDGRHLRTYPVVLSIVRFSNLIQRNWMSHASACCGVRYEVFACGGIDTPSMNLIRNNECAEFHASRLQQGGCFVGDVDG